MTIKSAPEYRQKLFTGGRRRSEFSLSQRGRSSGGGSGMIDGDGQWSMTKVNLRSEVTPALCFPSPVLDIIVLQVSTTYRFVTHTRLAMLAFLMANASFAISFIDNLCTRATLRKDELRESTVPMRGVVAHRA